jgi:hypothetical protein
MAKRTYTNCGNVSTYNKTKDGLVRASGKIKLDDKKAREKYAKAILEGKDVWITFNEFKSKFEDSKYPTYFAMSFGDIA